MTKKEKSSQTNPKIRRQRQILLGGGLFLLGLLLIISFVSYSLNWKEDYSSLGSFFDRTVPAKNILSKVGAIVSHLFIYQGVGFASLLFPYLLCLSGFKLFFDRNTEKILSNWSWGISHIIWLTIFLGYLFLYFVSTNAIIIYNKKLIIDG